MKPCSTLWNQSTNPKIAWNDLKWCEAQSIWPCGSSFWLTPNQSTHAILGLVLWFQRVLQGFIGTKLQVKLKLSNCLIVFQIGVSTFLPRFHQVFYLDFIKFLPFYLDFKRSSTRFQQVKVRSVASHKPYGRTSKDLHKMRPKPYRGSGA